MCVHTLRARPIFRGHLFFFRECQLEGIISSKGRTIPKPMLFFLFYFQIQRQIATSVQVDRGFFSHLRRRVRSKYMIKSSVIFRILHSQHIIICIWSNRVSFWKLRIFHIYRISTNICTWIFQVYKMCVFSTEKRTKRQKFYISGRSRYTSYTPKFVNTAIIVGRRSFPPQDPRMPKRIPGFSARRAPVLAMNRWGAMVPTVGEFPLNGGDFLSEVSLKLPKRFRFRNDSSLPRWLEWYFLSAPKKIDGFTLVHWRFCGGLKRFEMGLPVQWLMRWQVMPFRHLGSWLLAVQKISGALLAGSSQLVSG